jgi:hypothetical protein
MEISIMKAKLFIAAICIALVSVTLVNAQIGANFSNPCLGVKKGPNTLKTIKHESHGSSNRFNAHHKIWGNGHPYYYGNQSGFQTKNTGRIKKHKMQPTIKMNRPHRKKSNKHRDRGDRS